MLRLFHIGFLLEIDFLFYTEKKINSPIFEFIKLFTERFYSSFFHHLSPLNNDVITILFFNYARNLPTATTTKISPPLKNTNISTQIQISGQQCTSTSHRPSSLEKREHWWEMTIRYYHWASPMDDRLMSSTEIATDVF